MTRKYYKIAEEFTDSPGGNLKTSGDYSGQEFYEDHLKPIFDGLRDSEILVLDFDGVLMLAPSFISEAFGRLYLENGGDAVWERVEIKSNEDLTLSDFIIRKL